MQVPPFHVASMRSLRFGRVTLDVMAVVQQEDVPTDAIFVHVDHDPSRAGNLAVWYLTGGLPASPRTFAVLRDSVNLTGPANYLGTVVDGRTAWHVLELHP